MRSLRDKFLPRPFAGRLVEVGSADVAGGSYRELFPPPVEYVGVDLAPGPGVDVVLSSPYALPFEDQAFDLAISGQTLEHVPQFWRTFGELARVANLVFLIVPSDGPIHRFPVDCYRFLPDSMAGLAEVFDLELVECYRDERGPWRDLVAAFRSTACIRKGTPRR
jgi:hypothetical protein